MREGKLEGYRRTHCIGQLSRLEAVFAFPSIDDAKRGIGMLGRYEPENLVEIAPLDSTYRREVYDMGWATNFDALGHDAARRYWSGETYPGEDSVSEMLLSGRFAILGTRVRTKAYETVLERDPKSVCLLEISRLAAFFGSDLGMVCPWIKGDEHGAVGYYIIRHDLEEASKVDSMIVEEIKRNPSFEINLQALKPFFLPPDDPEGEDYFRVPNVAELGPFRLEKLHLLIQTINGSAAL
ncbi:hypothetical protein [Alitabrizicola rongguiensis]|uniref:hypothetical protein n=1 Tax=Alitabrizicola rongguiensis TaxID=2909234 RepID=UPI001F40672C|nr:hypothetical protein [Tabrizicola rongguiensis]